MPNTYSNSFSVVYLLILILIVVLAIKYTPLSFVYTYFIKPSKMIKGEIKFFTHNKIKYFVYLPKDYNENEKYPVLFHLHGAMPFAWKMSKVFIEKDLNFCAGLLESLVEKKQALPMLMVAPYDGVGMSMWTDDWKNETMAESDLIEKLVPHIQEKYSVYKDRENTILQGFSMGGFGATKIGFKYPELFGKIISLDGAIHNWETISKRRKKTAESVFGIEDQFNKNSPWKYSESYAKQQDKFPLRIFIVRAWVKEYNNNFRKHLQGLGIDFTFIETSCQHDVSCMLNNEKVSIVYRL